MRTTVLALAVVACGAPTEHSSPPASADAVATIPASMPMDQAPPPASLAISALVRGFPGFASLSGGDPTADIFLASGTPTPGSGDCIPNGPCTDLTGAYLLQGTPITLDGGGDARVDFVVPSNFPLGSLAVQGVQRGMLGSYVTNLVQTTVVDPGTLQQMGFITPFPDNSSHSPNYLLGTRMEVTGPLLLTAIGVEGRAGGPQTQLALYDDDGANGYPGTLLAETPPFPLSVGQQEVNVVATPLTAGTYWIMGIYETNASIGIDQGSNDEVAYWSMPFGDPIPDPAPSPPVTYTGQTFNYWVTGF